MATDKELIDSNVVDLTKKLCPRFGTPCKQDLCFSFHSDLVSQAEEIYEQDPDGPKGKKIINVTGRVLESLIVRCSESIFHPMVMSEKVNKDLKAVETDEGTKIVPVKEG